MKKTKVNLLKQFSGRTKRSDSDRFDERGRTEIGPEKICQSPNRTEQQSSSSSRIVEFHKTNGERTAFNQQWTSNSTFPGAFGSNPRKGFGSIRRKIFATTNDDVRQTKNIEIFSQLWKFRFFSENNFTQLWIKRRSEQISKIDLGLAPILDRWAPKISSFLRNKTEFRDERRRQFQKFLFNDRRSIINRLCFITVNQTNFLRNKIEIMKINEKFHKETIAVKHRKRKRSFLR